MVDRHAANREGVSVRRCARVMPAPDSQLREFLSIAVVTIEVPTQLSEMVLNRFRSSPSKVPSQLCDSPRFPLPYPPCK